MLVMTMNRLMRLPVATILMMLVFAADVLMLNAIRLNNRFLTRSSHQHV